MSKGQFIKSLNQFSKMTNQFSSIHWNYLTVLGQLPPRKLPPSPKTNPNPNPNLWQTVDCFNQDIVSVLEPSAFHLFITFIDQFNAANNISIHNVSKVITRLVFEIDIY